ncbi:MAG: hypothetical protein RIB84_03115 [Sneathiellaceae bacterium]
MAVTAALLLGGCSFASDSLWPSVGGDLPSSGAGLSPTQPVISGKAFTATPLAPVSDTGTAVSQKVVQLRDDLQQLRSGLGERSSQLQALRAEAGQSALRYHGTIAAITTKLQLGTTPANPILVSQWNQAQGLLDRLSAQVAALDSLSNLVAADSSLANYLLDNARTIYALPGAIDEDHRQLSVLEDEINSTIVLLDRLLTELNEDVNRQSNYVATERSNISTLSAAINAGTMLGPSLQNRSGYAALAASGFAVPQPGGFVGTGRPPLVVIRFDRPNVPYAQPLYNAVSQTLQAQPQALFDVVAVASVQGGAGQAALNQNQTRRNAEQVMRTLSEMGLPANRVALSSTTAQTPSNEVRIYVR